MPYKVGVLNSSRPNKFFANDDRETAMGYYNKLIGRYGTQRPFLISVEFDPDDKLTDETREFVRSLRGKDRELD